MEPLTEETNKPSRFGRLWHNPDFLKLWVGQTISALGSHITGGGLPLLAVITLQASPFQMGLLGAIGSVSILLFSLVAGIWVDRLRRRPILILTDLLRALLLFTIPLAAFMGKLGITQIYIVTALVGVLNVLFNTAYRAYLPSLVERENLVEGNSKLALSDSATEIVGPGLTGLLVQTITAPIAILFDALSFLVSVVSLSWIRKPEPPPAPSSERESMLTEAREGVRAVMSQPVLRALTATATTRSFFGSFFMVLYALYSIRVLQISPAAMGITIGVGGVSSLLGALLAEGIVRKLGLGRTLIGVSIVDLLFNFLIPIAAFFPPPYGLWVLIAAQFGDIMGTTYFINEMTLRQAITPGRLLGRVNATTELMTAGIAPLGALVGGFLGGMLGIQNTLFVAAIGIGLSVLWLVFSPIRHLQNFPSEPGL
jgi:MFS family permease